ISVIERPLARAGKFKLLSTLFVLVMLAVVSLTLHGQEGMRVFIAGTVGLTIYLAVRFLNELCYSVSSTQTVVLVGRAALMTFIYLEVLDASFSLDSVVGAFAITDNVLIIALGLGIGALVVRQLTVLMVRKHALNRLIYLEHGAQYSVGGLAILLALGMIYNVSGVLTGLVGLVVIGLSVWSSLLVPKTA
ncbi:MAG TPA: DUF475 domain-containing protein, partial [Candidatus Saccharimonadia bacterium]|nr:DUF475 domain-containing protein [Candidatus Saccharimonadia bacterium]